jgi:D-aminoacyl-tRNA deacylase
MKALVQRVSRGSVAVNGGEPRAIGRGLVVLLGVAPGDTEKEADRLARKILGLRLFPAADQKSGSEFDLSVQEIDGEILAVSQFTLFADVSKGRRPDFTAAAPPDAARELYESFVATLKSLHPAVTTGEFGACMSVEIVNEGPVTIPLEVSPGK